LIVSSHDEVFQGRQASHGDSISITSGTGETWAAFPMGRLRPETRRRQASFPSSSRINSMLVACHFPHHQILSNERVRETLWRDRRRRIHSTSRPDSATTGVDEGERVHNAPKRNAVFQRRTRSSSRADCPAAVETRILPTASPTTADKKRRLLRLLCLKGPKGTGHRPKQWTILLDAVHTTDFRGTIDMHGKR